MAVNRQKGLLRVATSEGALAQPTANRIAVPDSGSAAALSTAAAASGQIANDLAGLGAQISAYADYAAAIEGARAGRKAGLDPEFRPKRSATIRGQAYDRAGLETYRSRVAIEVDADIQAGGDLAAKRDAWLGKVPEELQGDIAHMFRRGELVAARKAAREQEVRIKSEATAALETEVDGAVKGLHQRAYQLGLDANADKMLATDLSMLAQRLRAKGPDGQPLVSPVAGQRILRDAKQQVTDARLFGAFERLPSVEAKQAMLDKLEADFKASKGLAKHYDLAGYRRITAQLGQAMRAAQIERRQAGAVIAGEVNATARMFAQGHAPTPDQLAGLRSKVAASGDPAVTAQFESLEDLVAVQAATRQLPPRDIEAYAEAQRRELAEKGPTPHGVARVELLDKLAVEARKELKTDPLGWAERVGLTKVAPLDFSDPDKTQASIKARLVQAETIADHYHQPPVYLRPDERQALLTLARKGPDEMLGVTQAVVASFGDRARRVLAELSREGPELAALGNLQSEGGRLTAPAARAAAVGLALRRIPDRKPFLPATGKTRPLAAEAFGQAYAAIPEGLEAVSDLAGSIYEARATRLNLTEFDPDLYRKALRQAAGEIDVGGTLYGGITTHGGWFGFGARHVLVPSEVRQDRFDDVIELITDDDLVATGHDLRSRTGPITAEHIKSRGTLVSLGGGRYRIALGDPNGPAPQWVANAKGAPATLDLTQLIPRLRPRQPSYFLGVTADEDLP